MAKPHKIVVIDDDVGSLHLIGEILEPLDCDVRFGTTANDAFELIDTQTSLVLLDYHLPEMDGLEICRRLHEERATSEVPVIFITADHDEVLETKGLESGAVDFITKPYSFAVMAARVKTHLRLKEQSDLLRQMARIDDLTGVYNRRFLFELAGRELSRCRRNKTTLSVFVLDIDHFKRVNDEFGHDVGDQVLVQFAKLCATRLRASDLFARIGGEEFVALLPEADLDDAATVAQQLCDNVASEQIQLSDGRSINISVSIGVATLRSHDETLVTLIKRADENLYVAKRKGRNRVIAR